MPRKKKLTEAEAKLKKKEYDRKRREKMKESLGIERLRENERLKYMKKKEKGQVKPISVMSSREKRQKRKQWKKNSQTYRDKKAQVRKNQVRVLEETPPLSPRSSSEPVFQNNDERNRETVTARRRSQLRRRRAIFYATIARLQEKLKGEIKKREKFRKRCLRQTKNVQSSPQAKVSAVLKKVQVPETVKKKLLFAEVITKQLKISYSNIKKHSEKRKYFEFLRPDLLKKNKLLHLSKPFFNHETYKKSGCRKVNAKMMNIKKDVTDFLEKDENSRMCPGKNDFIRSKGQVEQKRLLCDTMRNLHKKFLTTVNYKISLATFCKFRPFWVTWANVKERNTCKCVIHANVELMVAKLHESKVLPYHSITRLLATITCDVHSAKCLLRECDDCKHKSVEYYLPQPNKIVTCHQWVYETTSYEKDGKMKMARKPVKKETKASIKKLVQQLEEKLPSFFQHVATIVHQYKIISELKQNLTENDVFIHIDFSENYSCKYNEEIQAVHFGGSKQQITLHTGVLYLRRNDNVSAQAFCSLSNNGRHDTMAVWAHLRPIFEWLKNQDLNVRTIHILSDSPVNQYKNKYMFHIVSRHINDFFPGTILFSWHYSEPGHGKGAPDGVGGTLKRTADKAVAEGQDIVDLSALKNILLTRCRSIMLFEVTTADITEVDNLVKQSESIAAFRGTQKIRQFVFYGNELEFRRLSCTHCVKKCCHFHLGYYSYLRNSSVITRRSNVRAQSKSNGGQSSKDHSSAQNVSHNTNYDIGDYVLIRWDGEVYPGEIVSVSEEGALVRCMKKGIKSWRWPIIKDEQLYAWKNILQKIKVPKLAKRGCYYVEEIDNLKLIK